MKEREAGAVRTRLPEVAWSRDAVQRVARPQPAASNIRIWVLVASAGPLGRAEQRGTNGFDPAPVPGSELMTVSCQPKGRGGGDLRRRGGGAGAIHIDNVLTADPQPRDIWGIRRDRRRHLAGGSNIAFHWAAQTKIRMAPGHDAAGRDHAPETRGVNDQTGRQPSEAVAG